MFLVGGVLNYVQQPPTSALEAAHQEGLVFVAMDARAYATFRGGVPTGEWVVTRRVQGGALQRAGLSMTTYGAAAGAWGMKMAQDPVLTAKFTAMVSQP